MIVFVRTASVMPGQMAAAMKFAGEIKQMVEKISGVQLMIMVPIGGNPNQINWRTSYDSMAELDAAQTTLMADEGYMKKLGETGGLFVPGSVHDQVLRVVG